MCTVSYFPGKDFTLLTSNRDEHISRATDAMQVIERNGIRLNFPQDPQAQGSWISIAPLQERYACLLNGAFVKHTRTTPYRLSRGILLLDALSYEDGDQFLNEYDLDNIEPFTLILGNSRNDLEEIRWDGEKAHHVLLNPTSAHLWCSPTLYSATDSQKKEENFKAFISSQEEDLTPAVMCSWHHGQYYQDTVQWPISDKLKTLSITQIKKKLNVINIKHHSIII